MTKRMIPATFLVALLCALPLMGCSGGEENAEPAESAAESAVETPAESTVETPAESTVETPAAEVAVHDCDGGCGMTNVPVDKMTEVDGKFYCAGCAAKLEGGEEEDHSGHDHG